MSPPEDRRCFGYVLIAPLAAGEAAAHASRLIAMVRRARPDMARLDVGGACFLSRADPAAAVEAHAFAGAGVVFGSLFNEKEPQARFDPEALLRRHWGRYVAFGEEGADGFWLLRDPSGAMPAFYVQVGHVLVAFSEIEDVIGILPRAAHGVDWRHVASFLRHPRLVTRRTGVCGVKALLPGEVLLVREGVPSARFAWRADPIASTPRPWNADEAGAVLTEAIEAATTGMTQHRMRIAHQLSGGLDSSVVLSVLRRRRDAESVECLTFYDVCGRDGDERAFARVAAAANGCALREVGLGLAAYDWTRIAERPRAPGPSLSMLSFADPRYDAVARELAGGALCSGEGGDHMLLRINPVEMAIDGLIRHRSAQMRARIIADVARVKGWSFWSVLAAMARRSLFGTGVDPSAEFIAAPTLMAREVMHALTLDDYLHPWLMEHASLTPGKGVHLWTFVDAYNYHNPSRLNWAIDAITPLLAQPVAEACLSMPAEIFCTGGEDRAPMRRAFAGQLPRAIRYRRGKGGLTRAYSAVLAASAPSVRALLLDGELARQGLIDAPAVAAALEDDALARAPPLEEIFALCVAEAWVAAWRARTAAT